jgi:hypothetical protein
MHFEMVIIILLIAIGFMIYYYLTDISHKFDETHNAIVSDVEVQFDEQNGRQKDMNIELTQQLYDCKQQLYDCQQKIQELHTFQQNIHETNAINDTTRNGQFRYSDEDLLGSEAINALCGGGVNRFVAEHFVNSAENSCSPQVNMNGMYFIAKNIAGRDSDNFYMSDRVVEILQPSVMQIPLDVAKEIIKNHNETVEAPPEDVVPPAKNFDEVANIDA